MALRSSFPLRGERIGAAFLEWLTILENRKLILDLGSGEQGELRIATTGRIVRVDIQARFRPSVVGDAQTLPFRDSSADAVLAMSILEHVARPWRVVDEMFRVLRPGGIVIGYVPYLYPYHADETFHDYFRFSDEALESLFDRFSSLEIASAGGYTNALMRLAAGFTASQRHFLRFERITSSFLAGLARSTGIWESTRIRGLRRSTTGYNFLARR